MQEGRSVLGITREPVPASHFVVCGDDPLAHRLVETLVRQYKRQVTVILPSRRLNHGPDIARLGVEIIESDRLNTYTFLQARLRTAEALALVRQDDVGNLHAALRAQEINPDLRLVLRMFNMSLGHGIRALFKDCRVLSDASIAAPAFVAAAFGEVAPSYVRLPGHTLFMALRDDVSANDVVCGLADTRDGQPVLLPSDQDRCDLVLARANGVHRPAVTGPGEVPHPVPVGRRSRKRATVPPWVRQIFTGSALGGALRIAALVLLAVIVAGTGILAAIDGHLSLWQAFYLTVLDTVGGANPDTGMALAAQIIQIVVVLAGLAMVPVITAAVVEAVVNARLATALGRLPGPIADHVVVVGLGNVGTRVIQQLHDLAVPVVAIDRNDDARGAEVARQLRIPLILGDASRAETLNKASIGTARALVALSTDDVINLEAALHARNQRRGLNVVLRLFDGDFADRVQKAFGITSSKSVSFLAAPAFTAAMLEREVIGTIPVQRQVLLVAEVTVARGSALAGRTVERSQLGGEARVIAVTSDGGRARGFPAQPQHKLVPGDVLTVVATREGLREMLILAEPQRAADSTSVTS
jgi:Trk K+ transport system NAD-binding subunit